MTSADYMAKAYRALASARLLLADGDTEGACNRAYYAMFDAAQAVLLHDEPSLNPASTKTHRGLIAAFGERLVKTGRVPVDFGRQLTRWSEFDCWLTTQGRESTRKSPGGRWIKQLLSWRKWRLFYGDRTFLRD